MKEDIKRMHKELYDVTTGRLEIVNVPEFNYLKVKGLGNPRTVDFKAQTILLRTVCKEIKNYYKDQNRENEYISAPIEGVWKTYGEENIDIARETNIKYTLQVIIPDSFDDAALAEVMEPIIKSVKARARREAKKEELADDERIYTCMETYLDKLYIKKYAEGHCIQTLHVGPYNAEINTTSKLMEFITISNMRLHGLHHEIYLNDYIKVIPERLKTIIRYPIA